VVENAIRPTRQTSLFTEHTRKATEFFSLYGNITSIAINFYDTDKMKKQQKKLKKKLKKTI
jgi:hypothetical protein